MGLFDRAVDGVMRFGQGLATRVLSMAPPITNTARERALAAFDRLYFGTQYEDRGLAPSWDKAPRGSARTPLRFQKPSVQYDLPRLIIDRPTSLLFGEARFPELTFVPREAGVDVAAVALWLAAICEEGDLPSVALSWSRQGGVLGSGVLTWAVVEGEIEFEAHKACYCAPSFHPRKRTRMTRLEKRYKFSREVAEQDPMTQVVTVRKVDFWHREVWDEVSHVVFQDEPVGDGKEPVWKEADRVEHNFGRVPGVWVKNLDDGEPSNPDGLSLLAGIGDAIEDIDRTLSQKSRAVRYNQEPERVYFGMTDEQRRKLEVGGGASTALPKKSEGGEASLLELKGDGQRVAEEHIVAQRARTLEVTRVVSPDAERLLAAAKSGKAIELLLGPMFELVGELRSSYGRGLREIFMQILDAARTGKLAALGELNTPPPEVIPEGKLKLSWGKLTEASSEDIAAIVTAAVQLKAAGLLDLETIIRFLQTAIPSIGDAAHIMELLAKERAEDYGLAGGTRPGTQQEPAADDEPNEPADGEDGAPGESDTEATAA